MKFKKTGLVDFNTSLRSINPESFVQFRNTCVFCGWDPMECPRCILFLEYNVKDS